MANRRVLVKSKKRTVSAITNPNKVGISISSLSARHPLIGTLAPPVKARTPFPTTLQVKRALRDASLPRSYHRELHCLSQNSTDKLNHQVVPRNSGRASVTPSTRPRRSAPRSTNPDTPRCLTRVLVPEIPRRNYASRTTRSPVAIPTTAVSANITQPESGAPRWGQYPRCRPQQRRSNNRRPAPVGTPWW